jgi:hypothetical protein
LVHGERPARCAALVAAWVAPRGRAGGHVRRARAGPKQRACCIFILYSVLGKTYHAWCVLIYLARYINLRYNIKYKCPA